MAIRHDDLTNQEQRQLPVYGLGFLAAGVLIAFLARKVGLPQP